MKSVALAVLAISLTGCAVYPVPPPVAYAPAPVAAPAYYAAPAYAPGYYAYPAYAPAYGYYGGPNVALNFGFGHGGGHWR